MAKRACTCACTSGPPALSLTCKRIEVCRELEYEFIYGYNKGGCRHGEGSEIVTSEGLELELELIQTQMAQKPMLRAEVGMRVRCANKASAE